MPPRPSPRQPVRIRRARRTDLPELVALENRVFAGDRMSARQFRRHLGNPGASIVVAVRDEALVGAAVVFFHGAHRVARLYSIAVSPEARGAGVGEALLSAAERVARLRGSTSLRLEVRADNTAAQNLYDGRGYRRFGRKDGYYEDGAAALRYEKALVPQRRAVADVSPFRP